MTALADHGPALGPWLPRLSLIGAIGLGLAYLVQPAWLAPGDPPSHGWATLACLGLCAMFVHGVGFLPRARIWRFAVHPAVAWTLAWSPFVVRWF